VSIIAIEFGRPNRWMESSFVHLHNIADSRRISRVYIRGLEVDGGAENTMEWNTC
jgi:hypothetical protein